MRLLALPVRREVDVVVVRQRSRDIAALLGFEAPDQTRLAAAVSEIARNALVHGGGGQVEYFLEGADPGILEVAVTDHGPGIPDPAVLLEGRGPGMGLISARRLADRFWIDSPPGGGTRVLIGRSLPRGGEAPDARAIAAELAGRPPDSPYQEVLRQNQELLAAYEALRKRQEEMAALNRELEDTNRGVVALYAELDARADALRRSNDLKTRFLSNMTHEFRTPLNSILSLADLLLARLDGPLTAEQETQVGFIRSSAVSLSELVNDLLDIAKVEAGKTDVRTQEFEVAGLFGSLRGMLRPLAARVPQIQLVIEEPGDLPRLRTDEGKISQILRNLVSNALKFTSAGEVRVRADARGPEVVFSVSDTGVGIAPGDRERIFEEFGQSAAPVRDGDRGTGLGLSLSRRLATLLGGTIELESTPGKGSTFRLAVPAVYGRAVVETVDVPPDLASPRSADRLRVALVIDDDPASRYLLAELLPRDRFSVLEASGGREGLEKARASRPDLILLDLSMPDMDGTEVLRALKDDPATRDLPVVVCTSRPLTPTLRRSLAGAAAVLPKGEPARDRLREIARRMSPTNAETGRA